jgi:hypothetical protein
MPLVDETEIVHRNFEQIAAARDIVDKTRTVIDVSLSMIERSRAAMLRCPPRFELAKKDGK